MQKSVFVFTGILEECFIGLIQSKKITKKKKVGASICAVGDYSSIHSILMF